MIMPFSYYIGVVVSTTNDDDDDYVLTIVVYVRCAGRTLLPTFAGKKLPTTAANIKYFIIKSRA